MPTSKIGMSISSLQGLHSAGLKLRKSQTERDRFVNDPVKYLKTAGLELPLEFATELRTQAFRINEVLSGKHDPVASIAVA